MRLVIFFFATWMICLPASGDTLPFDLSAFSNPSDLIDDTMVKELVKAGGMGFDHRWFRPATPLNTNSVAGFELGLEATIFTVPDALKNSLEDAGFSAASSLAFLPSPKLHLHKGIGPNVDFVASGLYFQGYMIWALGLSVLAYAPEEGPQASVRLSYNQVKLDYLKTKTWGPQVVVSRQLDFADPYIGVGVEFVSGSVTVPLPDLTTLTLRDFTKNASALGYLAFFGVDFRLGPTGVKITLEGTYHLQGFSGMGAFVGFGF